MPWRLGLLDSYVTGLCQKVLWDGIINGNFFELEKMCVSEVN